jgi:hypothetical protein
MIFDYAHQLYIALVNIGAGYCSLQSMCASKQTACNASSSLSPFIALNRSLSINPSGGLFLSLRTGAQISPQHHSNLPRTQTGA